MARIAEGARGLAVAAVLTGLDCGWIQEAGTEATVIRCLATTSRPAAIAVGDAIDDHLILTSAH